MPASTKLFSSIAAISGAILLFVGNALHPSDADPNTPTAAFAEYATSQQWVAIHLTQLLGVALIVASLVLLARQMEAGPAADWVALAKTGASAGLALFAALQAIDGVALKALVDNWAVAAEPDKAAAFQAALAVRHIEIGLASVSATLLGLTIVFFGVALLLDGRLPRWTGVLGIAGGAPTAVAGVVIAFTGFSGLELDMNMVAGVLIVLWMMVLGVYIWKQPTKRVAF